MPELRAQMFHDILYGLPRLASVSVTEVLVSPSRPGRLLTLRQPMLSTTDGFNGL